MLISGITILHIIYTRSTDNIYPRDVYRVSPKTNIQLNLNYLNHQLSEYNININCIDKYTRCWYTIINNDHHRYYKYLYNQI